MALRRVLPSPTRMLTLSLIAGLLLTGSFDPFTGSTGDARLPPPTTTDDGETNVSFQCYQATIETNTSVTAILHFPDGSRQQSMLSPGTHTVQGTGDNSGKPLTAITIDSENSVLRYDNPRYPGCEQTTTATTTATSTTTTTETTTSTTATTTTSTTTTTTTTNTTTPTTTTPQPTTTSTTSTIQTTTTATTLPATTSTSSTVTETIMTTTETPSTQSSTVSPSSTPTATSNASPTTTTRKTAETTGATEATQTTSSGTVRESSTVQAATTLDGETESSAGGIDRPDRGNGGDENIEWSIGDVLALLALGFGGTLIAGPSVYSRVAAWLQN